MKPQSLYKIELLKRWKHFALLFAFQILLVVAQAIGVGALEGTRELTYSRIFEVLHLVLVGLVTVTSAGFSYTTKENKLNSSFVHVLPLSQLRSFTLRSLAGLTFVCISFAFMFSTVWLPISSPYVVESFLAAFPIYLTFFVALVFTSLFCATEGGAFSLGFLGLLCAGSFVYSFFWRYFDGKMRAFSFLDNLSRVSYLVLALLLLLSVIAIKGFSILRRSSRYRYILMISLAVGMTFIVFYNVFIDLGDTWYLLTHRANYEIGSLERQQEIVDGINAAIRDYKIEKYGPPCYKKYDQVLEAIRPANPRENPSLYPCRKMRTAFTRRGVKKVALEECFQENDQKLSLLKEAIDCGRPLYPGTYRSYGRKSSELLDLEGHLNARAIYEYTVGDVSESLELFKMGWILWKYNRSGGYPRYFDQARTAQGLSRILWMKPDARTSKECLGIVDTALEGIYSEMKDSTELDALQMSLFRYFNELKACQSSVFHSIYVSWILDFYQYILLNNKEAATQEDLKWLDKYHGAYCPYTLRSTTLLAVRTRIEEMIESKPFYKHTPEPLRDTDLTGLAPELVGLIRMDPNQKVNPFYYTWRSIRKEVILPYAAFAAKVYRDTHGRFPDSTDALVAAGLINEITDQRCLIEDIAETMSPDEYREFVAAVVRNQAEIDWRTFVLPKSNSTPCELEIVEAESGQSYIEGIYRNILWEDIGEVRDTLEALSPFLSDITMEFKDFRPGGENTYGEVQARALINLPKHFWWAFRALNEEYDEGKVPKLDESTGQPYGILVDYEM